MKNLTKRLASIALVLVLLMGLFAAPAGSALKVAATQPVENSALSWNEDGVLKILAIGNSFSVDTLHYAYNIAKCAGVEKVVIGNIYAAGCSLEKHLTNATNNEAAYTYYHNSNGVWVETGNYKMSTALESDNWDFVMLQQASGDSGLPDTYSSLEGLIAYVNKTVNNDVTFIWNMTWAYAQSSSHSDFPNYNSNQMTMYNAIVSATKEKIVGNDTFATIIPAGTAIQNARTSYVGDTLNRDGYHLSYGLGRYIAALTFVKQLTGLSIDNVSYSGEGVTAEQKEVAIEAANNAVANPFEITQSALATAHSYGSYSVTQAATCTKAGEKTKVCSDCGKSLTVSVTPTGHSYGAWVTDKAATETDAGTKHRTCSSCGDTVTVSVPALGSSPDISWDFSTDCSSDFEKNISKFAAVAKANKDATYLLSYSTTHSTYQMKYPSGYNTLVGALVNNSDVQSYEIVTGYKFSGTGTGNNLIIPGVIYAKDDYGMYMYATSLTRTASGTFAKYHVYYISCVYGADGSITPYAANSTGTGTIASGKETYISKIVVTENATGNVVTNEEKGASFQKISNDDGVIRVPTSTMDLGALRCRYNVQTSGEVAMINATWVYNDGTYTYEYTMNECVADSNTFKAGSTVLPYSGSYFYNALEHTGYETACGTAGYSAANSNGLLVQVHSFDIYDGSKTKCEHNWVAGATTAPTCEAEGYTSYTCSLCGSAKQDDKVAALGHTEVTDAGFDATCTEQGLTDGAHCSVCGKTTVAQEVIPALGHNFASSEVTLAPTCSEAGERVGVCTVCGQQAAEVIPALGHDLSSVTVDSTCEVQGSITTSCSRCDYNEVQELPLAEHSFGDWVVDKEATEDEAGSRHKTCSACGETLTEEIPALGAIPSCNWSFTSAEAVSDALANSVHIAGNGSYETANSISKCTAAYNAATNALELGYASNYANPINGLLVKTPEGGTLSSYSAEVGIAERNNVSAIYNGGVVYGLDDSNLYFLNFTYFSGFRMYYAYRNVANRVADVATDDYWALSKGAATQKYVDVKFYTIKKNGQVVADYAQGLETHVLESYADFQTYIATDLPAALSADSFKTVTTKYNVTVEDGVSTIVASMVFPTEENTYEVIFAPVTASSTGLKYLSTAYAEKAIDLTTSNYAPAAGVVMYGKPSSGNPAVQVYSLNVNYGGSGGGDTHEHSYTAVVTNPTCTDDGYTTYTCACGDTYTSDSTAVLGHNLSTQTVAATCVADGSVTTSCSRCDYVEAETVPALGHDYTVSSSEDATCTAEGIIMENCSRCGDAKTTTVPATGHNHTAYSVVAPTCTEAGFTIYTCSACSDTYTADEVAALGHDYVTTTTVDPTCTHEGLATTECSRCDYESVATIPALEHTESDWIVDKEATETEEGSKHTQCTSCGQTLKTEVIPALGSGEQIDLGDANGDGTVNVADAVVIAKFASGIIELEDELLDYLDVNSDGEVNTLDAILITRFSAGLITELPVK